MLVMFLFITNITKRNNKISRCTVFDFTDSSESFLVHFIEVHLQLIIFCQPPVVVTLSVWWNPKPLTTVYLYPCFCSSTPPSFRLSICLSVPLSVCLSICLSVLLSFSVSVSLVFCLPVGLRLVYVQFHQLIYKFCKQSPFWTTSLSHLLCNRLCLLTDDCVCWSEWHTGFQWSVHPPASTARIKYIALNNQVLSQYVYFSTISDRFRRQ